MNKITTNFITVTFFASAYIFSGIASSRAENFNSSFLVANNTNNTNKKNSIIYNPPPPPERKQDRTWQGEGSGSRSICLTFTKAQTLLAPVTHIGQTSKSHPTFSIYFSEVPTLPVSISVENPKTQKLIWISEIEVNQAGISTFSLPEDVAGLESGIQYTWTVALICDRDDRFEDIYAEAPIQRVEISQELQQKLSSTTDKTKKAQILASAGLFYDAIVLLVESPDAQKLKQISSLLKQAGLDNLASRIENSPLSYNIIN